MAHVDDPRPAIAPALFWKVLVVANLGSLAILLLAFHFMADMAMMPELGYWFMLGGVLLIFPAVFYQARTRRRAEERPAGETENARQLKQLNQLVPAVALAELPGLMATLYYLFSREWLGTIILLVITVVLLMRSKPQ